MSQGFTKDYVQPASGSVDVFINGTYQSIGTGTNLDITVPSGVKKFSVSLEGVSTGGTNSFGIQLSTGGSAVATGYNAVGGFITSAGVADSFDRTTMFAGGEGNASYARYGHLDFVLVDAATNLWSCSGSYGADLGATDTLCFITGTVALSGELDGVRLTSIGETDSFDAGSVNIQYENPDPVVSDTVYLSGGVVQTVHTQDGELNTGTTTMPDDNSIPQNTEGDEFMTASITPTNAANKLKIEVVFNCASTAGDTQTVALFQDSTAAALAAVGHSNTTASLQKNMTLTHWMTAGTASSTTFKVRSGNNAAGTTSFNGKIGVRDYGGVCASSITITEYKV